MALSTSRVVLVNECRELLGGMEATLIELGDAAPTDEQIHALFRVAHTMKGSAALLGLPLIVGFTHRMENVLVRVRERVLPLDEALVSLLLRCGDYIARLIDAIEQESESVDPAPADREELLGLLEALLRGRPRPSTAIVPVRASLAVVEPTYCHHLSLRFDPNELRAGVDPIALIDYLAQLGSIRYLYTLTEALPALEQLDPEQCYLRFELGLETRASADSLEHILTFVHDERGIRILPPDCDAAQLTELVDASPLFASRVLAILREVGRLSAPPEASAPSPLSRVLPEPVPPKRAAEKLTAASSVLKIDAHKLDELINVVSELVICSEGARTLVGKDQQTNLRELLHRLSHLGGDVRDRALSLRMVPIGEVFQRFPRVVREVARELNKRIEPVITGAETELDKAMVDKLADPLLHVVRNALDHGIERPEDRRALGKPEVGRISLHARHEASSIVIEVRDDGRGLDPQKIRDKAVQRGLIEAGAQLSTQELQRLIFAPGFSTAEQVTTLSGRGVGMDVVKRAITALRGEIEIESEPGKGTTFRLRLPLTLAIIDGFQVAVAGRRFVIPLHMVVECIDMKQAGTEQRVFNLRGEPLPFLRLRDWFRLEGDKMRRESLVVVEHGRQRVGLVVDRLLGDIQAVIKPLSELFGDIGGISSSTILGDGSVALILDVPAILARSLTMQTGTFSVDNHVTPSE